MKDILEKLRILQCNIHEKNGEKYSNLDEDQETLMFCLTHDGLFKIYYYGIDSLEEILRILCEHKLAEKIKSLKFDSPDEGANGVNELSFSTLIENEIVFPNLTNFSVKLNFAADHNSTIIGEVFEEDGQIAGLVKRMPKLLSLQIPSAPNTEFFQMDSHPLELLVLQTGFDSQNFIWNLSESNCFQNLRFLDFTDYRETYIEGWKDKCVPYEHFIKLFMSKAFDSIKAIILRDVIYTNEQLLELKSLRSNISFKIIRTESNYVNKLWLEKQS
jgi:hypothetical protein